MNPLTQTLSLSFAVIMAAMTLLWLLSLKLRNASIVDPFWGFGFIVMAATSMFAIRHETAEPRSLLLLGLVSIWGLRLSLYLLWRNRGHGEDKRYQAMRHHHGLRFWWVSLLTVFWLQALILWIVSLTIQSAIAKNLDQPLGWLDLAGFAVWCIGLFFETVGDLQMARFQSDFANAGRVMDQGLWRYTRHPNYFGDFCVWWGIYFISASGGAWWALFSPLLMSWLLLKVSGVTLLEKTITVRRPEYADYQQRTNAFFPGFPGNQR